ncbi:MAG: hypothetical protein RIS35_3210 [Pseudomonadota bacterium]
MNLRCSMRRRLAGLLLLPTLTVQATTYKWIDSEGRVNYGDRPPQSVTPQRMALPAAPAPDTMDGSLPFVLRNAVARNPVALYSTNPCGNCDLARGHLIRRGIPHSERTILTVQDQAAFRALGFTAMTLPTLVVGRERLSGYDTERLDRLLDTAGYPKASLLPPAWRPAASSPLAPRTEPRMEPESAGPSGAADRVQPDSPATTLRPEPASRPGASTGIRF